MPTALTAASKERIRYHLGYLNVEPAAAIALGFPSAQQAGFLVESAMERVVNESVGRIEKMVSVLEGIESQMIDALHRLKAQQLGELKLRNSNEEPTEQDKLEDEYSRWAQRLADNLGVPLNTYSARFRHLGSGGGGGMNVRVVL